MLTNEEIARRGPIREETPIQLSLAEVVARLLESDPHGFSTRPCQTCNQVSAVLGRPFGCQALKDLRTRGWVA